MSAATVRLWDPLVRLFHCRSPRLLRQLFLQREGRLLAPLDRLLRQRLAAGAPGLGFRRPAQRALERLLADPRAAGRPLRDLWQGRPHHRLGHSPLGALVMLLMMTAIGGMGVTASSCARWMPLWGADWPEDLHACFANGCGAGLPACRGRRGGKPEGRRQPAVVDADRRRRPLDDRPARLGAVPVEGTRRITCTVTCCRPWRLRSSSPTRVGKRRDRCPAPG